MRTETVITTIVNGYIHPIENVKMIDITFADNCVSVYRNNELVTENVLRVSVRDFRNNVIPMSHNIKLIYAMSQLDTNYPMRDIEFASLFIGATVTINLTFVDEGDCYEVGGIEKVSDRNKVFKNINIDALTIDGEKFCNYPLEHYHTQEYNKMKLFKKLNKENK